MDTQGWTKAKILKYHKLLKYLSNPDNAEVGVEFLACEVLGYKQRNTIYSAFKCEELTEIYDEGLALCRKQCARLLRSVDLGMLKQGAAGNPAAAKLVYQRIEGWSEKIRFGTDDIDSAIERELERMAGASKDTDVGTPPVDAEPE